YQLFSTACHKGDTSYNGKGGTAIEATLVDWFYQIFLVPPTIPQQNKPLPLPPSLVPPLQQGVSHFSNLLADRSTLLKSTRQTQPACQAKAAVVVRRTSIIILMEMHLTLLILDQSQDTALHRIISRKEMKCYRNHQKEININSVSR
uniref:Uncharacterized protein n=1 Tax=Glossina palpalis gambiensis TaxID=67801 RepID=A0A1B0ATA6_9MUSC